MLPLEHVRVLDMTQVLAGPFCTMTLADMGADVIKVEQADRAQRRMGFPLTGEDGSGFIALNRNKRSVALDLKDAAGRRALHDLVATADVFVENYRVGVTRRLGVDWPTLQALNPRLVYASISGFGQTGPYADRPGYDLIAQGMSGIMSVTGEPGGPPVKCGLPVSDLAAGLICANAVLVAIIARERTGVGQYIDTSLFEAALALSVWESTELWSTGRVPRPLGSAHRGSAPYQAVRARDGYLTIGVNNERFWRTFCTVIDRVDLIGDARFATNADRRTNLGELVPEIEAALATRTVDDWLGDLLDAGVPAGPIHDYAASLDHPQTRARDMVQQLEHGVEGPMPALGIPAKLSATPGALRTGAPLLGEHTEEVLLEVGYDRAGIDRLLTDRSAFSIESLAAETPPPRPPVEDR
ncbi:CoA transferase [Pseudonocardia sp. MH-G8]|nr:CoA transferase [Pseudonocardia sp. MH-G8]